MIILTIRTDKPTAEIGLYQAGEQLQSEVWEAHRQLAETIHLKIKALLDSCKMTLADVDGIIVFKGPGSFTGLRIGLAVTNALAISLNIPVLGATGDDWVESSLERFQTEKGDRVVVPEYGSLPNITAPRK